MNNTQVMLFLSLLFIKKDLNYKMEKKIHFALGSLAYFPCALTDECSGYYSSESLTLRKTS
jgi:hypothetical protein